MDTLMNKLRLIFSGTEEDYKADQGGSRDQKTPIQKKEKAKSPNWIQRQISRKMSHDYDSMEYATAVAAAAFAINSKEIPQIPEEKRSYPREASLMKTRSKVDGTKPSSSIPRAISKTLSGSFKSTSDQGNKAPTTSSSTTEEKKPEKTITPAPSMKKASSFSEKINRIGDLEKPSTSVPKWHPTFGDLEKPSTLVPKWNPTFGGHKNLGNTDDIKPDETPAPIKPPPIYRPPPLRSPPPLPPPPPPPITQPPIPERSPTLPTGSRPRPSIYETKADAWERNQLQKIKERYEKLMETIDSWEKRKKNKARRKLNKHEQSENERKRTKAMKKYEEKMKYIDEIAGGARAEANSRRRNEEAKAKDKANIIRTTGELPRSCSCF